MKEKKWLVPDVIDPAAKVCVQLEIPNDIKHIAAFWGALEQLSKAYNWEDSFSDGSDTAYVWRDVIADASASVRVGENCMVDCGDIEDCLDTSPTITTIEGDIINNTTNVTTNTTSITECQENPPDGNVYPDAPDQETEPDPACGAAYYVVAELREFIVDLEDSDVTYPTLFDAIIGWMTSPLAFTVNLLITVLTSVFAGSPSVLVDYDAQLDDMREELYCNGFDKAIFSTFLRTLTSGDEIADYLDCIGLSAFQQWYTVGSSDLSQDCTAYCLVGEPVIAPDSCYWHAPGVGTLLFLGGVRWRGTSTWASGIQNGVLIENSSGLCFRVENIVRVDPGNNFNAWEECDTTCGTGFTPPGAGQLFLNRGWTSNQPFTVEFDFYPQ